MSESHELAEGIVRVWSVMNPYMDMIVVFNVKAENALEDVSEAFESWSFSNEAESYTRGQWVREKLAEKYGEDSFEIFYSEEWG